MTAKRTDPHKVTVAEVHAARVSYRWECTRGCVGRWTFVKSVAEAHGRRHEERRIGRTTRG